jgi:hypothetical protein
VSLVSWRYTEDNVATGKNINVVVAAYLTTQARFKLYEYLSKLGKTVLYCDTDSVIYIKKVDEARKVKTDYLGDRTDELEAFGPLSFIPEFVPGGPKNYALSVFCPITGKCTNKCKVKGINLKYENYKVINFTSLRRMILEDDTLLHVHNRKKFKRKHGDVIVSEAETKEY